MNRVHVFISTGRFGSIDDLRTFVHKTYTEDGDGVDSPFVREVGLTGYEPGCIEAIYERAPTGLRELLAEASYAEQWVSRLDGARVADSAICVFAPNQVLHPEQSSVEYVGSYEYEVR